MQLESLAEKLPDRNSPNIWDSLGNPEIEAPQSETPEAEISPETAKSLGQTALQTAFSATELVENGPEEIWRTGSEVDTTLFSDIYDQKSLRSDENYVIKTERILRINPDEQRLSKTFEEIFLAGIREGNWLGGRVPNRKTGKAEVMFTVDARGAAKYDDYLHRIDAFSTLFFTEPVEDEDSSIDRAILGFDVSIDGDPDTIEDKFIRSYNDDKSLPFGFSSLKYYADKKTHGSVNFVPHYILGVSGYEVFKFFDDASGSKKQIGKTTDYKLNGSNGIATRFKILSEIRAENLLYESMLPDELDTPLLKQAELTFNAIDEVLNRARRLCVNELVSRALLPPKLIKELEDAPEFKRATLIEDFYLRTSAKEYEEDFKKRERKYFRKLLNGEPVGDPPVKSVDTFCSIIETCRKLQEKSFSGDLEEHRAVKPHNEPTKAIKNRRESRLTGEMTA